MFKILQIDELILLNKYAQGIIDKEELIQLFSKLDESQQQLIVKELWALVIQAKITKEDIPEIAKITGLKQTNTPVVMLLTGNIPLNNRGWDLAKLSGKVLFQAFLLVLECFAFAERRRRNSENQLTCNHWWHRDLSDENVIREIKRKNKLGLI